MQLPAAVRSSLEPQTAMFIAVHAGHGCIRTPAPPVASVSKCVHFGHSAFFRSSLSLRKPIMLSAAGPRSTSPCGQCPAPGIENSDATPGFLPFMCSTVSTPEPQHSSAFLPVGQK